MKPKFEPIYAAAIHYSEHHFVIQPVTKTLQVPDCVYPSDDPILNHERWSGPYSKHLIQLQTGTVSGVVAVRVNKPSSANKADGTSTFRRLQDTLGLAPDTAFFEDSFQRMYFYECHNEVIIEGEAEIADGITIYGNGASIILPPYPCYPTGGLIEWNSDLKLTRDNLRPISKKMMEYAVHIMSVTDSYNYHFRDAA